MKLAGVLGGFVAAVVMFAPRAAEACGSLPEPINYFTFAEPMPAAGSEDALLDAPIVLRASAWSVGGSPIVSSLFNLESMTVKDGAGLEISGVAEPGGWIASQASAIWRPTAPLAANTEYTVSAVIAQETVRPPEVAGSESIEFSFTTGSESAPPLELQGEIVVRLEQTELPVITCETLNNCGAQDCQESGTRPALMAHITLPAVRGGVDFEGYRGYVVFTDNSPAEFNGPGGDVSTAERTVMLAESVVAESAMAPTEVVFEVVDEEQAYRPCFAYNLWDLRGENVSAEPVCLEGMRPRDLLAADDPMSPLAADGPDMPRSGPEQPASEAAAKTSRGCSVSPGPSLLGSPWLAALCALLLLRQARAAASQDRC